MVWLIWMIVIHITKIKIANNMYYWLYAKF